MMRKMYKVFRRYRRIIINCGKGFKHWVRLYFLKPFKRRAKQRNNGVRLPGPPLFGFPHNIPFTNHKWSIRGYLVIFLVWGIPFVVFIWFAIVYLC